MGDLNYPARLPTLMSAGLPIIQLDNSGSVVATQALARELQIGLFLSDVDDQADGLHDSAAMAVVRDNVWQQRQVFTFDHHVDDLIAFFRRTMAAGPRRRE